MSGRQSIYVLGFHAGLAGSIVIAATVLGYHGTLDSATVAAIFAAALGFAGGTASSLGSLGAVVNGKSVITAQQIAEQGATQRTAIVAAASAQPRDVDAVTPVEHPVSE